jgi:protein-disulfide isomerase
VKKAQQRYWGTVIVAVFIGVCILMGLKLTMDVVTTNNNLRKEELMLSRDMVKQLAEIKTMISRMQIGKPGQGKDEQRSPCGVKKPSGGKQETGQFQIPPNFASERVPGVTPGASEVKGAASAPVLIVEFSDFECPFSKRFYRETFPQIEKEYISTGKVKFAYRDFPLPFHKQAMPAALASRCAVKLGKFWDIFDKFSMSEQLDEDTISISAKEVGFNKDNFNNCFNDPAIQEQVKKDIDEATKLGVRSTPSFFINGRKMEGAYPFEAFKKVIDEELKKAGK